MRQVQGERRGGVRHGLAAGLVAGAAILFAACGNSAGDPYNRDGSAAPPGGVIVRVLDTAGYPVVGATVYMVPNTAIDTLPFDGGAVLDGGAEDRDEPLEDAIRLHGAGFPQGVTNAAGEATIETVPDGYYYRVVVPGPGDLEHLPGGEGCRLAVENWTFLGTTVETTVSCRPPPGASQIGSTVCLGCHPAYIDTSRHAHRLGITRPGSFTPLQDPSRYPGLGDQWALFLPAANHLGGTPLWFYDYDPSRTDYKFNASLTDPGVAVQIRAWLWRSGSQYRITLVNEVNPGDPMSPWTLPVVLTYGGALEAQVNLVGVPGRKGRYPLLQWQAEGNEASVDPTRKVYRDVQLETFWNGATSMFQLPPTTAAFEGNCAGCHVTAAERFQDGGTGEWLTKARRDSQGVIDLDGDGFPDEVNVGCCACHGEGSAHAGWAANPASAGREARYIVHPEYLTPSRSLQICGACHDRPLGRSPVVTMEPLDAQGRMPAAGISRQTYLAVHTSRKGPADTDYWIDHQYSKSAWQQFSDFLKSPMYRNNRVLTVCGDCHGPHGDAPYEHQLVHDAADNQSLLCLNCHLVADVGAHTLAKTTFDHGFLDPTCVVCHMAATARQGAGRPGRVLSNPPMGPADLYFQNDRASHLFVGVPGPTNPDVDGVLPADAMPIPFTNACGSCHNLGALYPKPGR